MRTRRRRHPTNQKLITQTTIPPPSPSFPSSFLWGAATSSYQIEGATHEDGRGLSIWDTYCAKPNTISDKSNGDVACDHYHLFRSDVRLMKDELGLNAYRFSIAWSRILPNGTNDNVNPAGIAFYDNLIDALLERGIEPWVTLYHWDLPQSLEDDYRGWLGRDIVTDFGDYARICFAAFGDRVKRWITINESWTVAIHGYNDGSNAPGRSQNSTREPYVVGHHLILAHVEAFRIYKSEFASQGGSIGISHCGDFRFPASSRREGDILAAERAMEFQFGWFVDPLFKGDYPISMRERLGDRLPRFTDEERRAIMGSSDFIGLNHYSSMLASEPYRLPQFGGYWADVFVDFTADPSWKTTDMGWSIVPSGGRQMLKWIDERYDHPIIYVTENGTSEDEPDKQSALRDEGRREYLEGYIRAFAEAMMEDGVDLRGYFAWSLMDNFEWQFGYTKRFGLCRVDFDTLERTPKLSAMWYRDTIKSNGGNIMGKRTGLEGASSV